jgi:hypothetical protein
MLIQLDLKSLILEVNIGALLNSTPLAYVVSHRHVVKWWFGAQSI